MYLLICITRNDFRFPVKVSDRKCKLINYIKEDGYY